MQSIYNYPVENDKPATQSNQIQISIEIRFDSINICTKRNKPNAKQKYVYSRSGRIYIQI